MKKACILLALLLFIVSSLFAQRKTDNLDRGLVAIKTSTGVFCSWRIQANEYYGVKYNLYRNGSLIAKNLDVSNYSDVLGSASSQYTVKAVVNGVEQKASKVATVWTNIDGNKNPYFSIKMKDVVDRNGDIVFCCCGNHTPSSSVAQNYVLNDASMADLDGDGEVEIIIKRQNISDEAGSDVYSYNGEIFSTTNKRAYAIIEAYKLNGTRLWWIDCGPNMASMNSVEINAITYDWNQDGKAEVVIRGADNMIIHKADGTVHNVGDMNVNTRGDLTSHSSAQYAWTRTGAEYLLYLDGSTAAPYQIIDYPLPRYESDEIGKTEQQVWSPTNSNGGYGHRSSKYFFGAPFLDGRKPSIFLARGIYTQIKMVALDVDPSTHKLTTRWTWRCKDTKSSWFGQGNHNFSIADVDGDGCDEIIYGSMCIDNNGKGLSTTGLGHGDAIHVGDLDPFTKGLEVFACNEERPANNFRNATTSAIYYRTEASGDDGRAMAGNFSNDYPGCLAASIKSPVISTASHGAIEELSNGCFSKPWTPMSLNGRIYWDGDLLEEAFDSPGTERDAAISKNGNRILTTYGCKLNNDSKNNPCAQGDILGDWREELVLRNDVNTELRIYATTIPTSYRIPSLWYDPEYRQAMVWQVCGYNQPPHVSYFMGEMEGLTKVPVPLTMTDRTEVTSDGGTIPAGTSDLDVIAYGKSKVGIPSTGASPRSLIIDVPSTVSGNDNNSNISYSYSTTQLGFDTYKGDLTGSMNLVKQGDGLLKMTAREFSYTGNTDVFAGSLYFRGTLNSPVWMNRHTTLYTAGTYNSSVTMEYGSTLYINKENSNADGSAPTAEYATTTINTLNLHEGSRVVFDINASGVTDMLNLQTLSIRKRDWQYGPKYLAPVFQFNISGSLATGTYPLGTLTTLDGNLDDIIIEGITDYALDVNLVIVDGKLCLDVVNNSGNYIGNEDNTTGWWSEFSDSYIIEPGYNYNFKFTNYGNSSQNYYNWLLVVANGTGHSTTDRSDYAEHFVLRADNYGWGGGYNAGNLSNNYDWNTFKTDMTNAAVDMDIQFNNGVLTMTSIITCSNGKKYDYSYTSNAISADKVTVFFTVDHSHMTNPLLSVYELEPENVIAGKEETLFAQNFENSSALPEYWTTSVPDRFFSSQGSRGDGTYYAKYDAGGTNGSKFTYTGLSSAGTEYTSAKNYTLEFDFAVIPANGSSSSGAQTPRFTVYDTDKAELCHWEVTTPARTMAKNSTGDFYLGSSNVDTFTANLTPYFYHVKIVGSASGTIMTVTDESNASKSYTLSNGLIYIGNLTYDTGKQYGGLCLDNINLTATSPFSLLLSPTSLDTYEPGIYETVTLNRNFKPGYSTLCVPFNTTVSEFTGGDQEAYVAYLSDAEEADGICTLTFTNTQEIKANTPYILYLSQTLTNPSLSNKPVFAENAKTTTVGNWSMVGNYQVDKSMYGLYGVANNASIMRGGANSTINGFTAYLTGYASSARLRFSNGEETGIEQVSLCEPTIAGIYTLNGTRLSTPQKGINIIRMSDNTVRKVFIK